MNRLTLAIACAVCFGASTSTSTALARANDGNATRAYLHADLAYSRAVYGDDEASAAAIEARGRQIAQECPGSLTYAPRDAAFEELGEETETTVFYAGDAPLRAVALRLARSIAHLSWSRPELTRLVHQQAAEEDAIATFTPPDVCAQIAAWQASDYATLPASASAVIVHLHAIESESTVGFSEEPREAAILRMLEPYEAPAQRRTAKSINRLQARAEARDEAAAGTSRASLAAALGVSTL